VREMSSAETAECVTLCLAVQYPAVSKQETADTQNYFYLATRINFALKPPILKTRYEQTELASFQYKTVFEALTAGTGMSHDVV
jgi:hypothetical protein